MLTGLLALLAAPFALPVRSSASDVVVLGRLRYLCTEGDPRCDFDGQVNGRCTFRTCEGRQVCYHCPEPGQGPPVLELCTTAEEKLDGLLNLDPPKRARKVRVPLKGNRLKRGRRTIVLRTDRYVRPCVLVCLPAGVRPGICDFRRTPCVTDADCKGLPGVCGSEGECREGCRFCATGATVCFDAPGVGSGGAGCNGNAIQRKCRSAYETCTTAADVPGGVCTQGRNPKCSGVTGTPCTIPDRCIALSASGAFLEVAAVR